MMWPILLLLGIPIGLVILRIACLQLGWCKPEGEDIGDLM